jgi:hypothetical protein
MRDVPHHLGNPHHRDIFSLDHPIQSSRSHLRATQPEKLSPHKSRPQLGKDRRAIVIAAGLASRNKYPRIRIDSDSTILDFRGQASSIVYILNREGSDMSDIVTGLRQVIQDLVTPDLKSHTAKLEALQRQSEIQHDAVMKTLDAFRAEMRSEFAGAPCQQSG